MKNFTTCICILGLSGMAFGDVVIDQIGPDDGSGIGTNITGCQDFEAAYDIYDIATLDNFTGAGETINMVEMCLNGWNGFSSPASVIGYTANLHSDPAAAALDLIGDIGSSYVDAADATLSATWMGAGFVISMPAEMTSANGANWVSMVPSNDFATGGQTGCADSLLGDGTLGWQANPGGGFGMPGNMQEMAGEAAYRVYSGGPSDPCDSALPTTCAADIDGDGTVAVGDVLAIIGDWGNCGDGTFRPIGDIAPLPNGDCCTNVGDVLAVVGSFGADCTTYGACCMPDGSCLQNTATGCVGDGGVYIGDDTTCEDAGCIPEYTGCPDGSDAECGPCFVDGNDAETDCNGGPNLLVPTFQALATGTPMCGTSSVYVNVTGDTYRDLDWYTNADLNAGGDFTITAGTSGADLLFGIVTDEGGTVELWVMPGGYEGSVTFAPVLPGNYAILVAVNEWNTAWSCGSGLEDYHVMIEAAPMTMGACCMPDESCIDTGAVKCYNAGGSFDASQDCSTADCINYPGDDCVDPWTAIDGANPFDTSSNSAGADLPTCAADAGAFGWTEPTKDVWFEWTAGYTDDYAIDTCDIDSFDTSVVVYDTCGGAVVECNGDDTDLTGCQIYYSRLVLSATAGSTYLIRIGGWNAAEFGAGTLNINIVPPPMPGACCITPNCLDNLNDVECAAFGGTFAGEGTFCDDPGVCDAAAGDECATAIAAADGANAFTTLGMTPSADTPVDTLCTGTFLSWTATCPDSWMVYTATGGLTTFSTCNSADYDTSIVLYEGNCTLQVACNGDDASCTGYTSIMSYDCTAGTTYYIRVGGYLDAVGSGTLNITP